MLVLLCFTLIIFATDLFKGEEYPLIIKPKQFILGTCTVNPHREEKLLQLTINFNLFSCILVGVLHQGTSY